MPPRCARSWSGWHLTALALATLSPVVARTAPQANPTNHVIRANRDGLAIHPVTERVFPSAESVDAYTDHIFAEAEKFGRSRSGTNPPTVRLLVHVHGGLNAYYDARKRMELAPLMMAETNDWYYPVFIVWPSGFLGTYGEHLVSIRQGHKVTAAYGAATLPVVLVLDLLSALVTTPRHWIYQFQNSKDRAVSMGVLPRRFYNRAWRVEDQMVAALTNAPIYQSGYRFRFGEKLGRSAADFLQAPIRITAGTLVQSTMAQESWRNMNRRTTMLFYPSGMFDMRKREAVEEGIEELQARSAGAFFRTLIARIERSQTQGIKYEVTFVGHSMGAMVLNKLFTEYRQPLIKGQAVRNIVYMGAACSINQAANAIKPLLLACNTNAAEPQLLFYNLTLNRVAEISERSAWGFSPCGSLLDNVDDHLESPDTPLDRTMGSEVNVLSSVEVFKDVFAYCQFKSFDRLPFCYPAAHSDFHFCPFWRRTFWDRNHRVPDYDGKHPEPRNCYPTDWIEQEKRGRYF
jgi:predicted esterase